jgi:hypothetical protein
VPAGTAVRAVGEKEITGLQSLGKHVLGQAKRGFEFSLIHPAWPAQGGNGFSEDDIHRVDPKTRARKVLIGEF